MNGRTLAITDINDFIYGTAPKPVTAGKGLEIGGGKMIPEINFTLPAMKVNESNWSKVKKQYEEMLDGIIERAVRLEVPGVLVEFETLPEMTVNYKQGLDVTKIVADKLHNAYENYGLKNALRLTVNDIREFERPPKMRGTKYWDAMDRFFSQASDFGADLVAIESTGGKEVSDDALLNADLPAVIYALGVLGANDMKMLWSYIVEKANQQGIVPSGDAACGFANTAMSLAEQRMIPRVFAAVVRVLAVPRSLQAVTSGAIGPTKDCAYEGPYIKAITGVPISMEGRTAACAHLTPVGNIAQAVCDCWSNESVQNVRLLSANAPTVSMEQLAFDCRLANTAKEAGYDNALKMRDWLVNSDAPLDPQAYVLHPEVVLRISEKIIEYDDAYSQTLAAAAAAVRELKEGYKQNKVKILQQEVKWLDIMQQSLNTIPAAETELVAQMLANPILKGKYLPEEYGIGVKV